MEDAHEQLKARGATIRDEVLGSSGPAGTDMHPSYAAFQEVANSFAWGGIWARDGLNYRDRCLVTVVSLVAQGITDVLPMHLRGALRNGVTPHELQEALLHTALYAGFPKVSIAMKMLAAVLDEDG